jgi:SAM-dependent methyltransferase
MRLETLDVCQLCGSRDLEAWHAAPDRKYAAEDLGFAYSRCRACDVRFLSRRPTESTAGELYDERYEPYDVVVQRPEPPVELGDSSSRLPAPWLDLVRPVYRLPRPGARLLDFGCGSPYFLAAAANVGWTAIGADFSPTVTDRVRAAGFEACPIDAIEATLRDHPVDVVRMSHVLEHIYDPVRSLRLLRGVLRPGGFVHVAIPNPAGLSSVVFGRHWWPLEPRHVVQYPPARLRAVLEAAGFEVVGIGHQASPGDLCRSAGYALRSWRLDRAAAFLTESRGWARASSVVTGAAALAGRGDRLHAVGRA